MEYVFRIVNCHKSNQFQDKKSFLNPTLPVTIDTRHTPFQLSKNNSQNQMASRNLSHTTFNQKQ